jgi:hypothetical protein
MTAFDDAFALLKMPYHMTDASNLPSIMSEGLKPIHNGTNAGLKEALTDLEEYHDYDRDEAEAHLKRQADYYGMDKVEDLWDGEWIYGADEDHANAEDLANYANGHETPVLLHAGQYEDWMPDYGYFTGHQRSPRTIRPENLKVMQQFPSRTESGLDPEAYEAMVREILEGLGI